MRANNILKSLTLDKLQPSHIRNFLVRPNWSAKTQRTVKSTLSPLLTEFKPHIVQSIKLKKPTSTLHKPFDNINEILEDIKAYNKQLYLCCLMTYGCLLRPHREIRELTWSDFSDDLKYIHLSGNRNKSGRNRIVPVPSYIRDILVKGELIIISFQVNSTIKPKTILRPFGGVLRGNLTYLNKTKHSTLLDTLGL